MSSIDFGDIQRLLDEKSPLTNWLRRFFDCLKPLSEGINNSEHTYLLLFKIQKPSQLTFPFLRALGLMDREFFYRCVKTKPKNRWNLARLLFENESSII